MLDVWGFILPPVPPVASRQWMGHARGTSFLSISPPTVLSQADTYLWGFLFFFCFVFFVVCVCFFNVEIFLGTWGRNGWRSHPLSFLEIARSPALGSSQNQTPPAIPPSVFLRHLPEPGAASWPCLWAYS